MFKLILDSAEAYLSPFLEGKYLFDVRENSDSIEKSEKMLKKALAIDDKFSECHAILGMVYNLRGELDDAEDELEEALDIAEDNDNYEALSMIYNSMGIYYKDQKRFEKSIKFSLGKKNLLITFHPVTLEYSTSVEQMAEVVSRVGGNQQDFLAGIGRGQCGGGRHGGLTDTTFTAEEQNTF